MVEFLRKDNKSILKTLLFVCCLAFVGGTAFASGGGGGSSGGSGGSGGSGDSGGGAGEGGQGFSSFVSKSTYDKGKKIFQDKIVCAACPYSELELTPEGVSAVWKQLKSDLKKKGKIGSKLSRKERRATKAFIRERFSL